MKGYIYTKSNEAGEVYYVGSTFSIQTREIQHRSRLDVLEEVEVSSKREMVGVEIFWIEQFRQWGFSLRNRQDNLSYIIGSEPSFPTNYQTVVITKASLDQVRKVSKMSGMTMMGFISAAIDEKIEKIKFEREVVENEAT